MVDVRSKRCAHNGCTKYPSYGETGTKRAEYCLQHALDGMIDVVSKRCAHNGCIKQPSYGVAGYGNSKYCAQHALDGRCAHDDCTRQPIYGMPGTSTNEYCSHNALAGVGFIVNKNRSSGGVTSPSDGVADDNRRETTQKHTLEKTAISESLISIKHESFDTSSTQTRVYMSSGGSSRKRPRQLNVAPSAVDPQCTSARENTRLIDNKDLPTLQILL